MGRGVLRQGDVFDEDQEQEHLACPEPAGDAVRLFGQGR